MLPKTEDENNFIEKNTNKIIEGHSLEVLKEFPDESVQEVLTSPPYYRARDYNLRPVTFNDGWTGQLGLELSVKDYINHLCDIFDECKRVLKKDGTLWVNLGDASSSGSSMTMHERIAKEQGLKSNKLYEQKPRPKMISHLPQKCMLSIPARFQIEMTDNRGWILRRTIIWKKPNASPFPHKDNFTLDYEFVFFFAKSRKYKFNLQKEPLETGHTQKQRMVLMLVYQQIH